MEPREEIQAAQERIDELNSEKSSLQRAWEGEKERLGDSAPPYPPKLKSLNHELFFEYSHRDNILTAHPELQGEFGTPGRKKKRGQKSYSVCQSTVTAADRARRKKKIHPEFKAWCAAQRPQVKASLDNWENASVQNRFVLGHLAHPEFNAWCGEVFIPFSAENWKDDGIRGLFEEWLAERALQLRAAEQKQRDEEARLLSTAKASQNRARENEIQIQLACLPESFILFATDYCGVEPKDSHGILRHWRDEDSHSLYGVWLSEQEA